MTMLKDKVEHVRRASGRPVTSNFISDRKKRLADGGYPVSKWLTFCEVMLSQGFHVYVHEARTTRSKYVYVTRGGRDGAFKVRFSNHRPAMSQEDRGDSDFYVGVANRTVTTTTDAIKAVHQFFDLTERATA